MKRNISSFKIATPAIVVNWNKAKSLKFKENHRSNVWRKADHQFIGRLGGQWWQLKTRQGCRQKATSRLELELQLGLALSFNVNQLIVPRGETVERMRTVTEQIEGDGVTSHTKTHLTVQRTTGTVKFRERLRYEVTVVIRSMISNAKQGKSSGQRLTLPIKSKHSSVAYSVCPRNWLRHLIDGCWSSLEWWANRGKLSRRL